MKAKAQLAAQGSSLLSGIGLALLPKCPLCFAAYGSAWGAFGAREAAHFAFIRALFAVLISASLALVMFLSWRRRDPLPPLVGGTGALTLLIAEVCSNQPAEFAGVALLSIAAWLNARACRRSHAAQP